MPRRTAMPVPDAKLAFLAALRRGARVAEAARSVGVALWTFCRWRRSDALFDSAWAMAAEASLWTEERQADGSVARRRTKRRIRFGAEQRSRFLERLAGHCDTGAAAREAGFHPCTIWRHIARDAGFARANAAALGRGYDRLERGSAEAEAERRARLRARLETAPEPSIRGLDPDILTARMRRYERPDGSIGPRRVRRPAARHVWTFERAIALLDRGLDGLGIRRQRAWAAATDG